MANSTKPFLILLEPHYGDALKYCHALCRDRNDAADLFQQSALRGMEKLGQLADGGKFKAWFFRIITTTFYRQTRQSWWKIFTPIKEEDDGVHNAAHLFDLEEAENDRCSLLFAALAQLKPKERAALLLFEVGDFSLEEIREIQEEATLSAVKSRLSRSREKLRLTILQLEHNNPGSLPKGDVNHEATQLISKYK